jgi:hypothetical protein
MSRFTKSAVAVVRAPYTVVAEFWHNLQRLEVGAKVMLSDVEAKYHLLAGRLKAYEEPVVAKVEPVVAKVEAKAEPKKAAPAPKDDAKADTKTDA